MKVAVTDEKPTCLDLKVSKPSTNGSDRQYLDCKNYENFPIPDPKLHPPIKRMIILNCMK